MATKTQTKTEAETETDSTNRSSRIERLLHWAGNSPTFEIWLGLALMYANVVGVTLFNSWNMMWVVPIGAFFIASGVAEKMAKDPNRRE